MRFPHASRSRDPAEEATVDVPRSAVTQAVRNVWMAQKPSVPDHELKNTPLGIQSYLLKRYDWTLLAPTPVPPSQRVLGSLGHIRDREFFTTTGHPARVHDNLVEHEHRGPTFTTFGPNPQWRWVQNRETRDLDQRVHVSTYVAPYGSIHRT